MPKMQWDAIGERLYETGVRMGALYPLSDAGDYPEGVSWNGLTGVSEKPSGAEATSLYANDSKYLELKSAEDFGAGITAYTYPPEFAACNGSAELVEGIAIGQQVRKGFGLTYRTILGNDVKKDDYGYKLHIVYGASASPSEKGYKAVNESPEAIEFSWDITTTPVAVNGFKPTAYLELDSTKVDAAKLKELETILYGSAEKEPRLPFPDEIATLFGTVSASEGQG